MRERRRHVAANNRRGFVDKRVIFESRHHKEGKVHAARDVARQDGVANVLTPDWQTLALTFFEVAPSYNRPPRVARKHAPASLHLVIQVHDAGEASKPAGTCTSSLIFNEYTSLPSRVMCHPHENTRRAAGRA